MKDLSFPSDIPAAEDLEQSEFLSPDTQERVSFLIKVVRQDIRAGRDKLIQGKRIESISIAKDCFDRLEVRDKYERTLYLGGQPFFITNFILKIAVRCLQLKGYKVRLSPEIFSWWEVFCRDLMNNPTSPRRRMYVSVQKRNTIARVDDLTLMQAVEHVFNDVLGDTGVRH